MRFVLVLLTVILGVVTSLILNRAAGIAQGLNLYALIMIMVVLFVNSLRFVLWGFIYKKYDVSKSYPLTSMFFPLIFITSILIGESVFSWQKLIGVALITFGVLYYEHSSKTEEIHLE